MTDFHPHDLLRIDPSPARLLLEQDQPATALAAHRALTRAPWVVVRRAVPTSPSHQGRIPVGIRGADRGERFAAWLTPQAVLEVVPPPALRHRKPTRDLPVFQALQQLAASWQSIPHPWGPTGSAAFELASGCPAASSASDLDLLLTILHPISATQAQHLLAATGGLPVSADIQLETSLGGISLVEYLRSPRSLLLRTAGGPRLTQDPWLAETGPPSAGAAR